MYYTIKQNNNYLTKLIKNYYYDAVCMFNIHLQGKNLYICILRMIVYTNVNLY